MQAFFSSYHRYLSPDEDVLIAVSGGVDSMVLLDLMKRHHPKERIYVAHFDHSLRGTASDGDREFIANICYNDGIICEVEKMDIASLARSEKMSIEMAARQYRYAFFSRVAEKYALRYILTAHHQDDRIETMMFNLIRGTRLGGIGALKEVHQSLPGSDNLDSTLLTRSGASDDLSGTTHDTVSPVILRPLLHISKREILDYAREYHIPYREDSTNTDTTYLRNHLRHDILPEFEKINPEYRRSLEGFIEYSEELHEWIDMQVRHWLDHQRGLLSAQSMRDGRYIVSMFGITDFERESIFFQREIIRYLYEEAHHGTVGLSRGLIDELIRFITQGSDSYGIREVRKLRMERRGERIYILSIIT